MVDEEKWWLALAVAGLALVAAAFVLLPGAWQAEYHHHVTPVASSQLPAEAGVLNTSELSPAGRRAFLAAVESPDGHAVVYGTGNDPEEFFYGDYSEVGQGRYYVRHDGALYELTTHEDRFDVVATLGFGASVLAGGVAALAGGGVLFRRVAE